MILFVIAMEKEANAIIKYYNLEKVKENYYEKNSIALIITGITRNGVVKSLIDCDTKDKIIINLGLVGSNNLNIGDIVQVNNSLGYHFDLTPFGDPLYTAINSPYQLSKIDNLKCIDCYTSDGFVQKTNIKETCIFDMELNAITLFPHKKLHSIKIVSDTLSAKDYNTFNYDDAINNALLYIDKIISSYQK
jgi:nucleoside phosphorylase